MTSIMRLVVVVFSVFAMLAFSGKLMGQSDVSPKVSPIEAAKRHALVAKRRSSIHIICHRGASEFAHENTLEAYRATFELGGDGNEVDIRATKDGVLVCFHDDMLDQRLQAFGDVSDYRWEELQQFRFRDPGPFRDHCRIPTLEEVFALHLQYSGLLHLDIKRPGLDESIAELLTRMDLWNHVAYCGSDHADAIRRDPRLKLLSYKAGLYLDRGEVFPIAIETALNRSGDGLIVDDPRGVAIALGRKLSPLSRLPVAPQERQPKPDYEMPGEAELVKILLQADDWNRVASTPTEREASASLIRTRALAAEQLLALSSSSNEAFMALETRVRQRSLHKDWEHHGLDGSAALRALLLLRAPQAAELARFALWRDDPDLEPVVDSRWKNPRAWTDFRLKMVVFPSLEKCPGQASEKLCRDYLALSDEEAHQLGPGQFEAAAKALLAISPRSETAKELMLHRLQVVRGRAILECLKHSQQSWAQDALQMLAPHALAYQVPTD